MHSFSVQQFPKVKNSVTSAQEIVQISVKFGTCPGFLAEWIPSQIVNRGIPSLFALGVPPRLKSVTQDSSVTRAFKTHLPFPEVKSQLRTIETKLPVSCFNSEIVCSFLDCFC